MSYGFLQRWRPSSRSAVIPAGGPARRTFALGDVKPGWVVRDDREQRVGTVVASGPDSLQVERGIWRARLVVPLSAIHEVHEGELILNVSRKALELRR